ncbi:MAG: RHS repeat-associated core domain-containing protein, partial [Propionibacteriaceae bacterium]|nr:RHS repeat-associated core domain-containing protein [Propionibacteriaceae bacterium]
MRRATPTNRRTGHPPLAPQRAGGGNRSPVRHPRNTAPHNATCHATPGKCRSKRTSRCWRPLEFTKEPYGKVSIFNTDWSAARTTSSYDQSCLYTGRRLDSDTGLYFYRARYYHAGLGNFLSRDPVGFVDGPNVYAAYFV